MTSLKLRPALAAVVAGLAATFLLGFGLASQARAATAGPHAAVLSTPAPTEPHPFLQGPAWTPADAATGRIAATDEQGHDIIVMTRGGSEICVFATDPVWRGSGGGTCAPFELFNEQGMVGLLWGGENEPPTPDTVFGVLPDGVSSVQAHARGETTRTIRVTNNVFAFERGAVTTATFAGPSGLVRVHVGLAPRSETASKGKRKTARHGRHKANGRHAHRKGHGRRAAH